MPRFLSTTPDARLVSLPWHQPLTDWPPDVVVALPRGISRHVVRFFRVGTEVYAAKEVIEHLAVHEYRMLHDLARMDTPAVAPMAVVTDRVAADGTPLDPVLITRYLAFALPYRTLFNRGVRADTVGRLVDALVVLLARLHLVGFLWGDVSLSNTLFRRDAGSFAAYLVDAETGDLHDRLSNGQRAYDLEVARVNIIGELMDLQAGGLLEEDVDTVDIGARLVDRYQRLWTTLTVEETFNSGERWRVAERIDRLNEAGFDVGELDITTDIDGTTLHIQPKVVDAGHHSRRLMRLTGLDVQENQARRLLNDLDSYAAAIDRQNDEEEFVAHDWLTHVFEPAVRSVPRDLRRKLEPAQIFHELLDHRWFISREQGRDVPVDEAARSYVDNVLRHRPDELAILGASGLADDEEA
jgi:Domain of unknown function (DUF4032)